MSDENLTITLSKPEAIALHRSAAFFASAFEEAGVDLSEVELPNGTIGVSPMVAAVGKLEIVLMVAGVEL